MFEAWSLDRDFGDPQVAAFTVRLLMSKKLGSKPVKFSTRITCSGLDAIELSIENDTLVVTPATITLATINRRRYAPVYGIVCLRKA